MKPQIPLLTACYLVVGAVAFNVAAYIAVLALFL